MKKLLLFVLLAGLGMSTYAQGLSVGAKLGPAFSNMHGKAVSENKDSQNNKTNHTLTKFHFGVFGNYSFGLISAQAEINYAGKGYKDKRVHFDGRTTSENVSFAYLEIPLLAKATFGEDWPVQVFGEIGPFVGFNMGVKVDGNKSDPDDLTGKKYKEYFKGVDFGFVFGAGAVYMFMDNLGALANLRYTMGILKQGDIEIPAGAMVDPDEVNDYKTGVFNIDFGVVYFLD